METGTPISNSNEKVNKVLMSPAKTEHIGAVTCEAVLDYFKQPGAQEKFEAWLAERERRKK